MTFTVRFAFAVAVAVLVVPGTAPAFASVAVVGDSLGVGTEPHLRAALPGVSIEADVVNGRTSAQGLAALPALLGGADFVVFDLGTNDNQSNPAALTANLEAARSLTGARCLVLATLNVPPLNGLTIDGQNRAITDFAAATPTAVLVDWNAEARARPGLLADDGVHGTPAGYAYRGRLFAAALRSCPAGRQREGGQAEGIPTPRSGAAPPGEGLARVFTPMRLALTASGLVASVSVALTVAVTGLVGARAD